MDRNFLSSNGINFEHGISSFADRLDFDGGDKRLVAVEVAVAFGEGADGGEFIFTQIIGNATEPPPQDDHIGGGEGKSQFIRRRILGGRRPRGWVQGCIQSTGWCGNRAAAPRNGTRC